MRRKQQKGQKIQVKHFLQLLILLLSINISAQSENCDEIVISKIKGIAVSATPEKYETNPMIELVAINAEWIAIVPYAQALKGKTDIKYNTNPYQWWGEKPEGIRHTIRLAKEAGMKIMLKPQIYMKDGWVGHLDFESEQEWLKWEENFENYTLFMMEMAEEMNVDMFCMATEFKESTKWRVEFWEQLIEKCRKGYSGLLTFSANWDYYKEIPFWHLLDFIGVSAYFPLLADKTPTVEELMAKWRPIKKELKILSTTLNKPMIFTEFGYLSVDGGAYKAWLLEEEVFDLEINEQTQSNAIEALYRSFWNEEFWYGGFLWKWFPNGHGHTGYPEKDYCPRNKKAEKFVSEWFKNK